MVAAVVEIVISFQCWLIVNRHAFAESKRFLKGLTWKMACFFANSKILALFGLIFILAGVYLIITSQISDSPISSQDEFNEIDLDSFSIPANVSEGERKIIFLGSKFFGEEFQFKDLPSACRISTNPEDIPKADAFIYHALDSPTFGFHPEDEEERIKLGIKPEQMYVLVMYESAHTYPGISGAYNWTMTYRRDSDIHSPYCGRVQIAKKGKSLADILPEREKARKSRKKKKMVAWMVSNCRDDNLRLSYALELSKYISVDIYGQCSRTGLRCGRKLLLNIYSLSFIVGSF